MASMACKTVAALGVGSVAFAVAFVGCSSDDSSTPTPDGGIKQDSGTSIDAGPVKQTGIVTEFPAGQGEGVVGATIDLGGGRTTLTSEKTGDLAKGGYSIDVPRDTPFFMRISKPGFTTLIEQEWQLSGNADRGKTIFPDKQVTSTLVVVIQLPLDDGGPSRFPPLDPTKGVLAVGILKGTCADEGGATISLEPTPTSFRLAANADADGGSEAGTDAGADAGTDAGGDAGSDAGTVVEENVVVYMDYPAPLPDKTATKTKAGAKTPTALIYNVRPGNQFRIKVTHPTCDAVPFPFNDPDEPNIKYTGNIIVEPIGDPAAENVTNVSTFARVLLTKRQ